MADHEMQTRPQQRFEPIEDESVTAPSQGDGSKNNGKRKDARGRFLKIVLVLVVVFGALLLIGLIPRLHRRPQLNAAAKQERNATPTVNVVAVQQPPAWDVLTLPGNIQAVQQTAVTARASGYIKRWLVDIGDHVRRGQALALIDTPDFDQQVVQARAQVGGSQAALSQARANVSNQRANLAQAYANLSRSDATLQQARTQLAQSQAALAQAQQSSAQQRAQLAQAQANLDLARVTARRYENLLAEGAIDQQTTDQTVAAYRTNSANVEALQSAVRASEANVIAFRDAIGSSRANVAAYAEGVRSSQAQVAAAAANVRSAQDSVAASAANVRSNQANLARLAVLQGYQRVTAPFDGVITARNVDNGALISASGSVTGTDSTTVGSGAAGSTSLGNAAGGNATGSGSAPGGGTSGSTAGGGTPTSLFSIAQLGRLRIYISVPQAYVDNVRPGQTAQVLVRELPGKPFLGRVARTAGALDAATRTLVTEVDVANPQGLLRPGMFGQVRLRVPHPGGALLIPDSALVTNAGGTQAIVVGRDSKLHYQPITVGRDFGQVIEVTSGLQPRQQVLANPSDNLREGQAVHAQPAPPPTQGG
ncbi:MAG: efflux RND transporter periplasmic adaptor subunit [Armatimonadetes bacterium]|nr:efflux RND transporter periplasmic adaptor subunit [Armatimonadota bacterium]